MAHGEFRDQRIVKYVGVVIYIFHTVFYACLSHAMPAMAYGHHQLVLHFFIIRRRRQTKQRQRQGMVKVQTDNGRMRGRRQGRKSIMICT